MEINKDCIGKWDNCPEATTSGLCHKLRKCVVEISCMKVWLNLKKNN